MQQQQLTSGPRVVLVDDHPAIRAGLAGTLTDAGFAVSGTLGTVRDGVRVAALVAPDVVVVDHHLPEGSGLALCHRLAGERAGPRSVVFSAFADETLAIMALLAGAHATLGKGIDDAELCRTIASVAAGERVPPPLPAEWVDAAGASLDAADLPILGMVLHGVPHVEIAETMRIDERWLRARRWAMVQRLQARREGRRRGRPRQRRPGWPSAA